MNSDINTLIQMNRKIQRLESQIDFRDHDVYCIAKNGKRIKFLPHSLIKISLVNLFQKSDKMNDPIQKLAILWIGIISIHPFANGNGRTAKMFLKYKAQKLNLYISKIDEIDSILLTEKTSENIDQICKYLEHNIKENV